MKSSMHSGQMDVFANRKTLFLQTTFFLSTWEKWNVNKLKKIIIHQKQNWSERWIIWTTQMHSKKYTSPFQTFMYFFFLVCSNTVSYIFYHNIFPTQNNKGIFIGLAAEWSLKIGRLLIYFFFLHLLSKNVISFS